MVLTLPKVSWQDVTLAPVDVVTRDGRRDDTPLPELIAVGGPVSVEIGAADVADDDAAAAFVRRRERDFVFHAVHLACAFRPLEGEPFVTVTVRVELLRGDGAPSPRPIALSMKPLRLGEPVEVSRSLRLGATLKILEAGVEATETRAFDEPFLEGLNELRPDPGWELRRTRHTEIRGSQRFVLVVQSPRDAAARGTVALAATVERKRFGVLRYTGAVPGGGAIEFVLGQ